MNRDKIVKFCEDYLGVRNFKDGCHNGLQVEGRDEVKKIVTGVTFSQKLIEKAIEVKADMIVVHHGLSGRDMGELPEIVGTMRTRLKMLLENDINLCGFHLPLDFHPEIGNNISLIRELGLEVIGELNDPKFGVVGFVGELKKEMRFDDFVVMVNQRLETSSTVVKGGSDMVKKVGAISGSSSSSYVLAEKAGADTYLCGDIRESVVRKAEESNMNIVNAGHYNSEKLGIRNLGELIKKEFDVEVDFVDVPCEV